MTYNVLVLRASFPKLTGPLGQIGPGPSGPCFPNFFLTSLASGPVGCFNVLFTGRPLVIHFLRDVSYNILYVTYNKTLSAAKIL